MSTHDYAEKDLYIFDIKSGKLSRLTDQKGAEESIVVSSPDGKRVLFLSDKNGIKNIWLKDLETREERPITNSLDAIDLLSLSADGKYLHSVRLTAADTIFSTLKIRDIDLR
jgi:Tol biopolymer transport system component